MSERVDDQFVDLPYPVSSLSSHDFSRTEKHEKDLVANGQLRRVQDMKLQSRSETWRDLFQVRKASRDKDIFGGRYGGRQRAFWHAPRS